MDRFKRAALPLMFALNFACLAAIGWLVWDTRQTAALTWANLPSDSNSAPTWARDLQSSLSSVEQRLTTLERPAPVVDNSGVARAIQERALATDRATKQAAYDAALNRAARLAEEQRADSLRNRQALDEIFRNAR